MDRPLALQEAVERLSLGRGARKPVKDESTGVRVRGILQHPDGHIVRDKLTLIHVGLGMPSSVSPFDVGAENVTRGQVDEAEVVDEQGTLGAFACPGRAEEDNVAHGRRR